MKNTIKLKKADMVDAIEKSCMVINFDRKYLMRKDREYLERLYNHCMRYAEHKKESELES